MVRGLEEQVRVVLDRYDGKFQAGIRAWRESRESGEFWPRSNAGIQLRVEELPTVIAALTEVHRLATQWADAPDALEVPDRAKRTLRKL